MGQTVSRAAITSRPPFAFLAVAACAGGAAVLLAQAVGGPAARAGPATQAAARTAPLTTAQSAAVRRVDADLAPLTRAVAAARAALVAASLAVPGNDAAVNQAVDAVRTAELESATARAKAFATVQASPDRLTPEQAAAVAAAVPRPAGHGHHGPGVPRMTAGQVTALTLLAGEVSAPALALDSARAALTRAALTDAAAVGPAADAVAAADRSLATARAAAFAKVQASADRLSPDQVTALADMGGVLTLGGFTEPTPLNVDDHDGYVSLFDGTTLAGWDGDPAVWRVDGGAIVGTSTPDRPSGNTYLVCRRSMAHDFTLRFEIKVTGTGGSGMQYRSRTGLPWLAPVAPGVRPVNPDWMMTGPQADFFPSQIYTGQVYSENTPMRIEAWRGQVVEANGLAASRLLGTVGDRRALGQLVKADDWNQYTVIARGPTAMHVINGQLMAVLVDDDTASSNNQPGLIGVEIEGTCTVSVRNVWLKRLD